MRSIKALVLGLGLLATAPLAADTYSFDQSHTTIGFQVLHLGVTKVRGKFNTYQETVNINEKDVTKSKLELSIDSASVDTNHPKRNGHLNSPDFFDTAKYPKLTFKSTKIAKNAEGGYDVTGDLTIRDVKKSVTLKGNLGELLSTGRDSRRSFSLEGSINRMDYGVAWGAKTPGGTLIVAENVKLEIDGELVQAAKK